MRKLTPLSGRVKKVPSTEVDPLRYDFISLENAEPDLGVPPVSGQFLTSDTDGNRAWTNSAELVGYTGSQGVIGYTGSQGDIGYTGSQGAAGGEGSLGYTGSQGVIGYTGSQGDQGIIGYTGSQGDQGIIGYTGSQGSPDTAEDVLTKIKTVDGTGSGLDADLLDGIDSESFLRSDAADIKTSGDLTFNDNVKATFGTGNDLQIYHDGNDSFISDTGTGNLRIRADDLRIEETGLNLLITGENSGTTQGVRLFHADTANTASYKLATTSIGVAINGAMSISSIDGIGFTNSGGSVLSFGEGFTPAVFSATPGSGGNARLYLNNSSANNQLFYGNTNGLIIGNGTNPEATLDVRGNAKFLNNISANTASFTGPVTIPNVPIAASDAASKEYVDTIAAASIHYHDPVRAESPISLNVTYDNGIDGVGATLTNAGTQTAFVIDGVTLDFEDRVLIYAQTNSTHNGVYFVSNTGSISTNWQLTRTSDTDGYGPSSPLALGQGDAFYVKEGDTGAGELYVMTTPDSITFGTTDIIFSQISSAQIYSAGNGLSLNGTVFSIDPTADITVSGLTINGVGGVINSSGQWIGDPANLQGYTGSQGSQGVIGYTGSQGDQGIIGYTGSQGIIGYTGSQGDQGIIGYTGSQGDQGIIGYTGSQGADYTWLRVTANYTASNNQGIVADTSGGSFTITLPTSPSVGDSVLIGDGADWSVNNLTVDASGTDTIEGFDPFILNIAQVKVEFVWDGSQWQVYANISAAPTNELVNGVFYENNTIVSQDYTITSGRNAMSAGPITIADGVTVTIPDGSRWAVV
jgi:collagen type VII alpha